MITARARTSQNTYPLKLQGLGKLIFYRHIAHVTQKVEKRFVFLRGKKNDLADSPRPRFVRRRMEEGRDSKRCQLSPPYSAASQTLAGLVPQNMGRFIEETDTEGNPRNAMASGFLDGRNHWHLQGNQTNPGFLRWCEMDFVHPQQPNTCGFPRSVGKPPNRKGIMVTLNNWIRFFFLLFCE